MTDDLKPDVASRVRFADGLVPAVVQDASDGEVLMVLSLDHKSRRQHREV